ncbi:MAG: type II secretion system protein GspG [Leptospiraceae bacterium]|nr:type II secretion system protein GspG [Leptospiraceae bacterium]MCB1323457.1 type II secretion system protein GspG [Leptospiraceae bacterium]
MKLHNRLNRRLLELRARLLRREAQTEEALLDARRGLTLIELAIVILVIGIIMAIVVANLDFGVIDKAQILKVKNSANQVRVNLRIYEMDHSPLQEGQPITAMGINKDAATDPWGEVYVICTDPGGRRQVCSFGADRQPGGEGQDADIYLTDEAQWPAWLKGEVEEE